MAGVSKRGACERPPAYPPSCIGMGAGLTSTIKTMKASTLKQIRREALRRARTETAEAAARKDWRGFILGSLKIQQSKP